MFTPRKQEAGEASSPGLYGILKSGLSKVTGRGKVSSSPLQSEGAATPGSPESPQAVAQQFDARSPDLDDFVSPGQELAKSQQGTPQDTFGHGERMSAIGLLQHGSVLAGAPEDAHHALSITAHRDASPGEDMPADISAASQQALAEPFDPFSWPSQAAQASQEHPMPAKRSADVISTFLAGRQSKRQRVQALSFGQSSSQQLALLDTEQSAQFQPPAPSSRPYAFRSSVALPLPLPSPEPVAAPLLSFRRQGTPMPSRFAKAATHSPAFAKPVNPPPMFSGRPSSAGPFSMGTTRQCTPRPQPQRTARPGMTPSRSGRSRTTTGLQKVAAPANSGFRLGGSTQQDFSRSPQGLLPPARPSSFGSQPQPFTQAGTPQQAQQSLLSPSASHSAVGYQPAVHEARQTPTASSPMRPFSTGSGIQPQQSRAAASAWTPMKASNDLPRQALVNKLMKGKELPSNSLIGAGLDPTKSALTLRSAKHSRSGNPSAPKLKASELEAADPEQAGVVEGHGRHKQAKLAEAQPVESQTASHRPIASPSATPRFHGPVSEQPHSAAPELSFGHTPEATLTSGTAPFSEAAQVQPKDYGAPWAVAAAENDTAAHSPAAHIAAPSNVENETAAQRPAAHVSAPGNLSQIGGLPAQDAATNGIDQPEQRKDSAPSPSTAPPKQHSSLFPGGFANQQPSTSQFVPVRFSSTPSAAAPPPSPPFTFGAASQAASPATWEMAGSQPPANPPGSSQQQQQPEAAVSTPAEQSAVPVLPNGSSTHAGTKGQQAASTSSDGSGDTSVNLYPFPTERSAQDRLEGIVSSPPYAQDVQGLYTFGRSKRVSPEQDDTTTAAVTLRLSAQDGHGMASPSGAHQDTYLSPGQATRLHTLSSAVSLPDSESDEEPEMPLHANSHAAGLETAAPAEEGRALSITEGVQSTASEGSPVSDDDSASSISGMSGVSSVAATEVVDGEQDAAGVPDGPGAQAPPAAGWGDAFMQANKAAAQQAAEAPEAGQAQQQIAFVGEASKGQDEAAQQQQPIKEAAQAAADSHPQPAEHQKPAETPSGPSASENAAQFSAPNADAAAQSAAESRPKIGMPASSLLSSSDPAGAKAAPHLPWQPSQATWPARNAPSALLMQAMDAPLPGDPPLKPASAADIPSHTAPSGEDVSDAAPEQTGGKKPRRMVKVRRNK